MSRICPLCSGVVGAGVDWCGLCFADLRTAGGEPPAPVPAPTDHGARPDQDTPATAAVPAAGSRPDRDADPAEPAGPRAVVALPLVEPAAPVVATRPGWPCSVCSSVVTFEDDVCPVCGAGFLAALTGTGLPRLPVVGTPGSGRRGTWTVAAVVVGGLALLLLLGLGAAARVAG